MSKKEELAKEFASEGRISSLQFIPKGTKISGIKMTPDKPVAYLVHEATRTNISVYKPINVFQRCMIRICFGLRYVKV